MNPSTSLLVNRTVWPITQLIMATEKNTLIDRMFAAGAHFGFSKSRRHPTTSSFIYTTKDGNDIFDLAQTSVLLTDAAAALEAAGKQGKKVVLVGTKDEVRKMVTAHAEGADMPYVANRWIGGLLTNFPQMKKRFDRLKTLQSEKESGELDRKYTKKERVVIGREIDKLQFNFGGVADLEKTPDMMIVVDPRHDEIATTEANDISIPVVGVMSSDTDVSKVTYPVLVNDALTTSVELALSELVQAYKTGVAAYVPPARPDGRPARRDRRDRR